MSGQEREALELCPSCGSAVSATYGPDYRFNPPRTSPRMWTACCGGSCLDDTLSWTSFTKERALGMWNNGVRAAIARRKENHEQH